ncbi:hypothetical protein [uncultured Amnibacterium sp.]|uniref:hypothetical protein n=1 Tax=uncultured Amnibacterium sp. TaxID=1631851 RepID=UPI0035CBB589
MSTRTPVIFGAAAVSIAVGELTDVQSVGFTATAQVRNYLAAPALLDVAAAAFIVGALLTVLAIASFWSDVQGRGGRFTRVGLGMLAAGALWYAGFRAASDLTDVLVSHLPAATQATVLDAGTGWAGRLDVLLMLGWLLGPILLWIGLRRARRAHWLLLVVYLIAVAVEVAFAFVSLPVEALSALVAVGTIAVLTRPVAAVPAEAHRRVPAAA